jgi:DNA-binding NtrC family response regulator
MSMEKRKTLPGILICDDDALLVSSLKTALASSFRVLTAFHSDEALAIAQKEDLELVLMDVAIRTATEGLDFLPKLKAMDPDLPVVMLTGQTDLALVRRAMQEGAWDYVSKAAPRLSEELQLTIDRTLEKDRLLRRSSQKSFELAGEQKRHALVGSSASMARLRKVIERVRASGANVLITGETGTGKEVVARQLRKQLSGGELEPFVSIDSSTIQSTMAESILFGHQKGAFTGADQARKGVFEEADGGCIYFDELANMPLEIQSKLLRVVQEKEVVRLGSARPIALEFRVICATNQDLEKLVSEGKFKEDLFQRLNVLPLEIPPLRERSEDISELFWHFLGAQGIARAEVSIDEKIFSTMKAYSWPGNVRELSNAVSYILAMCEPERGRRAIGLDSLPPRVLKKSAGGSMGGSGTEFSGTLQERLESFERSVLEKELKLAEGNVSQMAQKLGVDRSNLHKKLKSYGISASR